MIWLLAYATGVLTGWAIWVLLFWLLAWWGERLSALTVMGSRTSGMLNLHTSLPKMDAMLAILDRMEVTGYSLDHIDEKSGRILLSTPGNWRNSGYFYGIYASSTSENQTRVSVDIALKIPGPWRHKLRAADTDRRLERAYGTVKAAVLVREAEVARQRQYDPPARTQ